MSMHPIIVNHRHRRQVLAAAAAPSAWDPNGELLSIWAAYEPKGAASYAASLLDLSGNGNDASTGVQPDWDAANGWKLNGSTHYLTTTFVPQQNQSQTLIIQFSNVTSGPGFYFFAGCESDNRSNCRFGLIPAFSGAAVWYYQGGPVAVAPVMSAGNLCVAGNQGYRNGIADGGTINPYNYSPDQPAYIGCYNDSGVPNGYLAAYIQALYLYDEVLTADQVLAVATAMTAI